MHTLFKNCVNVSESFRAISTADRLFEFMQSVSNEIYRAPEADLAVNLNARAVLNYQRFTAWGVVGLTMITFGIYPIYWLISRANVTNTFHPNKISIVAVNTFLASAIGVFMLAVFSGFFPDNQALGLANVLVSLINFICYFAVLFLLRNRLQEITGLKIGPFLTFFLNVIYLQYKINQSIDESGIDP